MIYALALAAQLMLCQDTASLSGRVTDAVTHLPIAGAVVDLTLPLKDNFFQGTDSDGVYRFESLPSGEAFVVVGRNGYVNLGGVVPADRVTIEVTGKSTRDFALLSGGKIFGRIVDADTRKPINDLAVIPRFIDPDPDAPGFGAMPEGVSPAVPNAAGEFALVGLKPGSYILQVRPVSQPEIVLPELLPEFRETPLSVGYGRSFYPESASVETALPITVAGGEHRDVEIVLHKRKQSRLRGTVNIVGDIRRELLVSMAIVQRGTGTVIGGGSIARAREFYVEPMPEGEFLISLTATGRAGAQFFGKALVRVNAHDTAEVKLTMQPGITVRGVLRFEDDGTVLPGGVGLELVSADGAPGTPLKADVGEKGLFRIDHVALGEYHVRLTGLPAGYAPMRRNVTVASGDLNVVITNKLGRITGKTTPGSRVVLRVEGEEDGWSNQIITADQEGVFTFANLAPGRYRVQGRSVEVEAGQTAEAK